MLSTSYGEALGQVGLHSKSAPIFQDVTRFLTMAEC